MRRYPLDLGVFDERGEVSMIILNFTLDIQLFVVVRLDLLSTHFFLTYSCLPTIQEADYSYIHNDQQRIPIYKHTLR